MPTKQRLVHKGITFLWWTERDDQMGAPWEEHDGHGVVTDWINTSRLPEDSVEREVLLRALNYDGGSTRFYDVRASMAKAIKEDWGPGTSQDRHQKAVQADYEYLRGWCRDEWEWVGVIVTLDGTDISKSLWGIESLDEPYHLTVAQELAEELIHEASAQLRAAITKLETLRDSVEAACDA